MNATQVTECVNEDWPKFAAAIRRGEAVVIPEQPGEPVCWRPECLCLLAESASQLMPH